MGTREFPYGQCRPVAGPNEREPALCPPLPQRCEDARGWASIPVRLPRLVARTCSLGVPTCPPDAGEGQATCHSLRGKNLRNGVIPPFATFCWGSRLDGCHGERLLRGQPREKHCRMKSLGPQGPGLSPTNHRDKASPTYAVPVLPPARAAPIQPLQHPLNRAREAILSRLPLHLPSTTAPDSGALHLSLFLSPMPGISKSPGGSDSALGVHARGSRPGGSSRETGHNPHHKTPL